ncbi:hypothetical protein DFH07DRAFT_910798 [Mycena maculata]|uniref:Cyclochlorotine biosynthesis protein O n=1 Tax=Mycena maculata TaxID=230809 RepID=A0AAD7K6T8_9AGAR|nr:hypothetical protein DFH07DRAFT_910798 [Mycena maculata]
MTHYMRLDEEPRSIRREHSSRKLHLFCILSGLMNMGFLWLLTTHPRNCLTSGHEPYIYSPAEHAVEHKIVKFTRGFADDIPIYERPPSPAVDEAWHELYSVAETKIPKSEAMRMPNRTWPIGRDPGNYMFALDVFHQLHCLDTLRKELHPGHNYTHVSAPHLRHCIGAIRQALMCSADISTVVFQWSEKHQRALQRDDIVHVCRDFNRIRGWASEHTFVPQDTDFTVFVEDDLTVPAFS